MERIRRLVRDNLVKAGYCSAEEATKIANAIRLNVGNGAISEGHPSELGASAAGERLPFAA